MVETEATFDRLDLPPVLDITTVQIWHENLTLCCENRNFIPLGGGAVERITSPGIQLLISLSKAYSENNKQLRIDNPSRPLQEAFADLGLLDLIKKWSREV